jgi:hypothetical protein
MTHKTAADLHFAGIYLVKTANEGGGGALIAGSSHR